MIRIRATRDEERNQVESVEQRGKSQRGFPGAVRLVDRAWRIDQAPRDVGFVLEEGTHQRRIAVAVAGACVCAGRQQVVERGGLAVVGREYHGRKATAVGGIDGIAGVVQRTQDVDASDTGGVEPVAVVAQRGGSAGAYAGWSGRCAQPASAASRAVAVERIARVRRSDCMRMS